jgi:hypothetical protein
LQREIEAARDLMTQIKALVAGDDEQAIADTFEGETTLDSAIRAAILANVEDEARVAGLKGVIEQMVDRRKRVEKRIEARRGLILQAMTVAKWPRKELDVATVSVGKTQAALEVDDESIIPPRYFKRADPVLDKTALKSAAKEQAAAIEEARKLKDVAERSAALQAILEGLPAFPDRNEALDHARRLNHPAERCAAYEAIAQRFTPIPGCHLTPPGASLTIRTR